MNSERFFSTAFWQRTLDAVMWHTWSVAKVVIFFLIVRFVAYRLIDRVMKSIISRETTPSQMSAGRVRTLGSLIRSVVFYVLIFISGIMILRVFDIDPAPVLTAAGVVGLAIGFGAQKLVKDVLSGFFLVLENQYSVGDYVTIGAVTGTVHELGMRITELRDDSGKLVIIPNGDITVVTNHSRGPLLATVDISVDPTTDLKKLQDILNEAGNEIAEKVEGVISAPTANGIIALDASKMTVRATGEVKTGRQFAVQNALRESIRTKLSDAGIQLAYEKVVKQL